ncbi:MAG: hypothetical protein OXI16_14335 [Chloroflexota bacterium]|nr:hypothetical protein [Chloroflexota bacterium]
MTTQTQQQVNWIGKSGLSYTYTVYELSAVWLDVPGNYIFAKLEQNGFWSAIYVGETGSFKTRLVDSHEKLLCAQQYGFTHVHARTNYDGESARLTEEKDLRGLCPPCNLE